MDNIDDLKVLIERLEQDSNYIDANEVGQMKNQIKKDISDAIDTITYLKKELETTRIFANNYKKALEAMK